MFEGSGSESLVVLDVDEKDEDRELDVLPPEVDLLLLPSLGR